MNVPGRWAFKIDGREIDPANGCSLRGKGENGCFGVQCSGRASSAAYVKKPLSAVICPMSPLALCHPRGCHHALGWPDLAHEDYLQRILSVVLLSASISAPQNLKTRAGGARVFHRDKMPPSLFSVTLMVAIGRIWGWLFHCGPRVGKLMVLSHFPCYYRRNSRFSRQDKCPCTGFCTCHWQHGDMKRIKNAHSGCRGTLLQRDYCIII